MDGQTFFQTILRSKSSNAPIQFSGSDETNSFPVKGSEVSIVGSAGDHEVGSSKLHIRDIIKFSWEHRYYPGQLVCHHISGKYIAYAIITPGISQGMVRVMNRNTEERTLIKGMKGAVVDVSFAHVKEDVVVGCVDEQGNLFVYRISESSSGLQHERVLCVLRDKPLHAEHRLIWCPYMKVSDEDEDDDEDGESSARLLVLTHGDDCEVWHVDTVVENHGTGPLRPEDVTDGLLKFPEAGGIITDAAFSPDGNALATASKDGQVKFFQVYMKGEEDPRCLHQWSPHGGKPVSSLLFLDDHSEYQPNVAFWKYVITGCDHNSELKIWSCETWSCLQTIKFQSHGADTTEPRLKIALDSTARYLLLSDIDRNLLYVLSVEFPSESLNEDASVVSVSEFPTPAPLLSFCCLSAGKKQVAMGEDGVTVQENGGSVGSKEKTVIKLCFVQTKHLQECSIIFDDAAKAALPKSFPVAPVPVRVPGEMNGDGFPSPLNPVLSSSPKENPNSSSDDLAEAASKINLISTNKFKPLSSLPPPDIVNKEEVELENDDDDDESEYDDGVVPTLEKVSQEKDFVSGNSSPSREVATILSTDERRFEPESPTDNTIQESPSPDFHSTKINLNTSGTIFPNPPSVTLATAMTGSLAKMVPVPLALDVPVPNSQPLDIVVKDLQKEIYNLRHEISGLNRTEQIAAQIEAQLATRLDAAVNRTISVSLAKMEQNMKKQEEIMINFMAKSITSKCDQILSIELKRNVAETVNRALEPLKARIDSQIGHKLSNADQVVRESVYKIVSNPGFQDSISKNVSKSLQPVIAESYREVLQANLPGMERMMKQILSNMNETFLAGTKEYTAELRGRLEASEVAQRDEISPYLRDIMKSLGSLSASQSKLSNQVSEINTRNEKELPKSIAQMIRSEVRAALSEQVSVSPGPIKPNNLHTDIKFIKEMASTGNYNEAFKKALSLNDLSLVMLACHSVNPGQMFGQETCPLNQSVILSLIQQLSCNLQEKTELKLAYLEEAVLHLDKNNSITKNHAPSVLSILKTSIQTYTKENPNSKHARNFKTLEMAAAGFIHEIQ